MTFGPGMDGSARPHAPPSQGIQMNQQFGMPTQPHPGMPTQPQLGMPTQPQPGMMMQATNFQQMNQGPMHPQQSVNFPQHPYPSQMIGGPHGVQSGSGIPMQHGPGVQSGPYRMPFPGPMAPPVATSNGQNCSNMPMAGPNFSMAGPNYSMTGSNYSMSGPNFSGVIGGQGHPTGPPPMPPNCPTSGNGSYMSGPGGPSATGIHMGGQNPMSGTVDSIYAPNQITSPAMPGPNGSSLGPAPNTMVPSNFASTGPLGDSNSHSALGGPNHSMKFQSNVMTTANVNRSLNGPMGGPNVTIGAPNANMVGMNSNSMHPSIGSPHNPSGINGKVYPPDQPMVFNPSNPHAPPIYPCGICHKEVHETDEAILCESGCNFWFHRVCTGLHPQAYTLLTSEVYAEWVCDKCLNTKQIPLVKVKA